MFFVFHFVSFILLFVSFVNSFSVDRILYEEERKNRENVDFEDASSSTLPEDYTDNQQFFEIDQNLTKEKKSDLKSNLFDKMLSEELLSIKQQLETKENNTTQFTLSLSKSSAQTPTLMVRQRWPVIEFMSKSNTKDDNIDKPENSKVFMETTTEKSNATIAMKEKKDNEYLLKPNKTVDKDPNEKVIDMRSLDHRRWDDEDDDEAIVTLTTQDFASKLDTECTHSTTRCTATVLQHRCTSKIRNNRGDSGEDAGQHNHGNDYKGPNSDYNDKITTHTDECDMHNGMKAETPKYTHDAVNIMCTCPSTFHQNNDNIEDQKNHIASCPPCPTLDDKSHKCATVNQQFLFPYVTPSPSCCGGQTTYPPSTYPNALYQPGISYYYIVQTTTYSPYAMVYGPNVISDDVKRPKHKAKHKKTTCKYKDLYYDDRDKEDEYDDYLENDFGMEMKRPPLDGKLDVFIKLENVDGCHEGKHNSNNGPYNTQENKFVNEIVDDLKAYYSDAVIKDCYCSSSSMGIISQIILISLYCLCTHTVPLLLFTP